MATSELAAQQNNQAKPPTPMSQYELAWATAPKLVIPEPDNVAAYLAQHPDLAGCLPDIAAELRQAVGTGVELSLELYRDPEIGERYLSVYVREEQYAPDIMERLEDIASRFHERLRAVSGHLLVGTDLLPPRGAHAV